METAGPAASDGALRYNLDIDPTDDSSHSQILRLVGANKRVLEIGPAAGSMTRLLTAAGCRVTAVEIDPAAAALASAAADRITVADLNRDRLADLVGDHRFDVVIAADVLEHLLDPATVLRDASALLADGGHVAVSLPNIAHGSVRLALLDGGFPYAEVGLLDRTHIRFFNRELVERLFADAGLRIEAWQYTTKAVADSEVPFDHSLLDSAIAERVLSDPDSTVYQFVLWARPTRYGATPERGSRPAAASGASSELVHEQGRVIAALEERTRAWQAAVENQSADLREADARAAQLEGSIRVLRERIVRMERSKGWRMLQRVRRLRAAARRMQGRR